MVALRTATSTSHRRLEKRLGVPERFGSMLGYRAHLGKMWGFHAPLETRLGADYFADALPDHERRRKLGLLTRDLAALGLSETEIAALPRCRSVPEPLSPAMALGCLYVLEGATLGGRTLLPLVEKRLGLSETHGACYLASYGENVESMWRAFSAAVEVWCCDADRRSQAIRAAQLTFDALTEWLCENPE